jgi:hypothetical protein
MQIDWCTIGCEGGPVIVAAVDVGSSLDEWLEEEAAKDPSFIVGLNEQLEKIRRAGSQKARADPLKALRSRPVRR